MKSAFSFLMEIGKRYSGAKCGLHAAGLTYFSILSIIPILLMMLLLTKPCGMYELAMEKLKTESDRMIQTFFAPKQLTDEEKKDAQKVEAAKKADESAAMFGEQARQLRDQIVGQIDSKIDGFNFGAMALVGLAMLMWTVASTIGNVESSFNDVWELEKGRPLWKKLLLYPAVLMALPPILLLAMSLPLLRVAIDVLNATAGATAYTKWAGDALVGFLTSRLFGFFVSLFFSSIFFALIYYFLPYAKVRFRPALAGGVVAALATGVLVRVCATAQLGIAKTSAAYGSFALLPILIVWIYLTWQLVLLGSVVSCAVQRHGDAKRGAAA